MGLTHIRLTVTNPANPRRSVELGFLVDSGAAFSVIPAPVLRRLGIKPRTKRSFILADGSSVERRIGQAMFRLNGDEGASPVIFGEKGDSTLLGVVSLEALGMILDPLKRELRPLPMILGGSVGPPRSEQTLKHKHAPVTTFDPDSFTAAFG
jgi:clan AA aspartic protease